MEFKDSDMEFKDSDMIVILIALSEAIKKNKSTFSELCSQFEYMKRKTDKKESEKDVNSI